MSLVADAAAMISEMGKTMTLSRTGETDISVKGKRTSGDLATEGGSSTQQTFRVMVAPTELLASAWATKTPLVDDLITVDGRARAVLDVQPRADGESVAMYELTVAG